MITETQVENFIIANTPEKRPFLRKMFTAYLKTMIFNSNISFVFDWRSLEPFGLSNQDFRGFDPRVKLSKDVQQLSDLIAISRGARNLGFYEYVARRFFPDSDVSVMTDGINYPRARKTDELTSSGSPFTTDTTPTSTTDAALIPSGLTVPGIYPDQTPTLWVAGGTGSQATLANAAVGDIAVILQPPNYTPFSAGTSAVFRLQALPPSAVENWVMVDGGDTGVTITHKTSLDSLITQTAAKIGDLSTITSRGAIASEVAMTALTTHVNATALVNGTVYVITFLGTTNWTLIGAPTGAVVGTSFTATGAGTGTGIVQTSGSPLVGSTCYRTDLNKTYALTALPGSVAGNWSTSVTSMYGLAVAPYSLQSNWRKINTPSSSENNGYPVTNFVPGGANPPAILIQVPYVLADRPTFSETFREFLLDLSIIKQGRTFALIYPRWETSIQEILADTLHEVFEKTYYLQDSSVLQIDTSPVKYVDQDWLDGTIEPATSILEGYQYIIETLGTTDFTAIGAAVNVPGTMFTATATGTGSGTVRTRVDGSLVRLDQSELTLDGAFLFSSAKIYTTNPEYGWVSGLPVTYFQKVTATKLSSAPLVVAWDIPIDSLVTEIHLFQPGAGGAISKTLIEFKIHAAYSVPSVAVGGQQLIRISYTFPGT